MAAFHIDHCHVPYVIPSKCVKNVKNSYKNQYVDAILYRQKVSHVSLFYFILLLVFILLGDQFNLYRVYLNGSINTKIQLECWYFIV